MSVSLHIAIARTPLAADLAERRLAVGDYLLRQGPVAEPLREGLRSLTISPLRVLYLVKEMDRIVDVIGVRRIHPPSPPQLSNGEPPLTG